MKGQTEDRKGSNGASLPLSTPSPPDPASGTLQYSKVEQLCKYTILVIKRGLHQLWGNVSKVCQTGTEGYSAGEVVGTMVYKKIQIKWVQVAQKIIE